MLAAHHAYTHHQAEALTGRALEAAIFERCAVEMHQLVKKGNATFLELNKVLERNRAFWAMCVTSCAEEGSPLPYELRVNIGQLAVFIEAQMRKALVEQNVEALAPIIFINRHLAAGLRGKGEGELPPLN